MASHARVPVIVASVASLPFVVLALAGCLYIVYSLVAEPWYRHMFGGYAARMLALYLTYSLGVVAAAMLATLRFDLKPRAKGILLLACGVGVLAALILDLQLWSDYEDFAPRGLTLVPFLAWALVGFKLLPLKDEEKR